MRHHRVSERGTGGGGTGGRFRPNNEWIPNESGQEMWKRPWVKGPKKSPVSGHRDRDSWSTLFLAETCNLVAGNLDLQPGIAGATSNLQVENLATSRIYGQVACLFASANLAPFCVARIEFIVPLPQVQQEPLPLPHWRALDCRIGLIRIRSS